MGIKEQVVLHHYMIYYGDDYHASVHVACADHARLLLAIPLLSINGQEVGRRQRLGFDLPNGPFVNGWRGGEAGLESFGGLVRHAHENTGETRHAHHHNAQ